jgi:hypothetical protein
MGLRPTNSDENGVCGAGNSARSRLLAGSGRLKDFNNLRWVFDCARVLQDPLMYPKIAASEQELADVDVGRRTGVLPHNLTQVFGYGKSKRHWAILPAGATKIGRPTSQTDPLSDGRLHCHASAAMERHSPGARNIGRSYPAALSGQSPRRGLRPQTQRAMCGTPACPEIVPAAHRWSAAGPPRPSG